jgi:cell division cycle 20-like protein 1, cofactor of APC complex
MFSKSSNEIVSTHGYSDNAVVVWKYPSLKKVATLTGHNLRVLYLAMSPDSETVVTGAGDETLRFWKLFPKLNNKTSKGYNGQDSVTLDPLTCCLR